MQNKRCKTCGQAIGFRKMKSGKWLPVDLSGRPHWQTCSKTPSQAGKAGREWSSYNVNMQVRAICG